ncbi:MAG: VIT1/CCC1 family protein [Candidatus Peribacteraceae bacterium]|nr:VIT1/CCC1 family protein [Candidatus Peribacteraceae bacterium]
MTDDSMTAAVRPPLTPELRAKLRRAARNEITEHHIYSAVAARVRDPHNRDVIEKIAAQELGHYERWRALLGEDIRPQRWKVWIYATVTSLLGLSFTLRFMEKGESLAQDFYDELSAAVPEAAAVIQDEQRHEEEMLALIDEEFLQFVSSFVLGINDALVELTGALAGLTLALADSRLIATVGFITGIAASLSMASAQYLSTKEEEGKSALKSGLMTGLAYIFTVVLLILPFFLISKAIVALPVTLCIAVLIIFLFTLYVSVAKRQPFKPRFMEMAGISLSVAAVNFGIGFLVKRYFGVEG